MDTFYKDMNQQMEALTEDCSSLISVLANAAALLYHTLPNINWAGFYLAKDNHLLLGPFGGKPACIQIPFGKGVCGTAAQTRSTMVVPDVHLFEGHIACDGASESEIVIPLIHNNQVVAVLDIDSPIKDRFSANDKIGLEQTAQLLSALALWDSFSVC